MSKKARRKARVFWIIKSGKETLWNTHPTEESAIDDSKMYWPEGTKVQIIKVKEILKPKKGKAK